MVKTDNGRHIRYNISEDPVASFVNKSTYYAIMRSLDWVIKSYSLKPPLKILDYGCGRGEIMKLLAKQGHLPLGCDIDQQCLSLCEKYGKVFYIDPENFRKALEGINNVDLIIMSHVLEHIQDPTKILNILKPKTKFGFILAVPNPHYMICIVKSLLRIKPKGVIEGHFYSWDWDHFKNFLEFHAKLKILYYEYDSVGFPIPYKTRAFLAKIRLLPLLEEYILKSLFPRFCRSIIVFCSENLNTLFRHNSQEEINRCKSSLQTKLFL